MSRRRIDVLIVAGGGFLLGIFRRAPFCGRFCRVSGMRRHFRAHSLLFAMDSALSHLMRLRFTLIYSRAIQRLLRLFTRVSYSDRPSKLHTFKGDGQMSRKINWLRLPLAIEKRPTFTKKRRRMAPKYTPIWGRDGHRQSFGNPIGMPSKTRRALEF